MGSGPARRTRLRGKYRPLDAEPFELAVELDRAAVAGAVATRHWRFPRELGARFEERNRSEHRLRTAGEHVVARGNRRRDVGRLDHDLRVRNEARGLGVPLAPEAEDRGRAAERLGEIRQRRDADPAADEQRSLDVEAIAVAERAEDRELVAGLLGAERPRAGADGVDQESELARGRQAEAHRSRQRPTRRLEHEELTGNAGIEAASRHVEERVGPDLLGLGYLNLRALH